MNQEAKPKETMSQERAKGFARQFKVIDRLKATIRDLLNKEEKSGHYATKIEDTDFGLYIDGNWKYFQLVLDGDVSEAFLSSFLNEFGGHYAMALSQEHNTSGTGGNYVESTQITINFAREQPQE